MNRTALEQTLQAAVAEGVLPADATLPAQDSRPWPVVLLIALGAWLAALPLLGVVGLLLGDLITRSVGPYLVGTLVLAGAVVVLRARGVALFVEQLAVPALLVGGGALAFGLFRDLPLQAGAAVLAAVAVGVAWLLPRPWLRVLLGAAAALLVMLACVPERWMRLERGDLAVFWGAWHACLAAWLVAGWVQREWLDDGARARTAAALESVLAGWLLATLAGLAWWSGMSFLVGGSLGGGFLGEVARELAQRQRGMWETTGLQTASVLLALAAAWWGARAWPTLRRPWCAGVAAVPVALAWFMPALGAVLLALALSSIGRRWRLAAAAALAAAWIVGSFYYQLAWPLGTKAVVLVGAAAVLGALAWWALRGADASASVSAPVSAPVPAPVPAPASAAASAAAGVPPAAARQLMRQASTALGALAVLVVANFAIWQKEDLIANGQPVYVELAPLDPRSLMQGDFMRLNFRIPGGIQVDGLLTDRRPRVVARRDARGVATPLRLDDGTPLAPDELRIELSPKGGRWILVSDAWFFKEGEATRWERAKYGEFRVMPDGKALLVGLRGARLDAL